MNCLTYLLDLWDKGHRFSILYNSDHCIGVNKSETFDLGNCIHKNLLKNLKPIKEVHSKDTIKYIFNLSEVESEILDSYYRYNQPQEDRN
jgi:hypothetical protein